MTIKMFYDEYDSVEMFEARQLRVKEFFQGFPAYTDVPLIEHQTDEWIAYGHVEPQAFISAIQTVLRAVTEDDGLVASYGSLQPSVGHLHARFVNPKEGHWDEGLEMCKASTDGCFPITRLTKEKS